MTEWSLPGGANSASRRPGNGGSQMLPKKGIGVRLLRVAKRGIKRSAATLELPAPDYGVIAHGAVARLIALLIERDQDLNFSAPILSKSLVLVGAHPGRRQVPGRGMLAILDPVSRLLELGDLGVRSEISADERSEEHTSEL